MDKEVKSITEQVNKDERLSKDEYVKIRIAQVRLDNNRILRTIARPILDKLSAQKDLCENKEERVLMEAVMEKLQRTDMKQEMFVGGYLQNVLVKLTADINKTSDNLQKSTEHLREGLDRLKEKAITSTTQPKE